MQIAADLARIDQPRDSEPGTLNGLPLRHLLLRLKPLNRALKTAAAIRAESNGLLLQATHQAGITEQHVRQLLADVDRLVEETPMPGGALALTAAEHRVEARLRQMAEATGWTLPLDDAVRAFALTPLETDALLICAAPQLRGSYERLYAFIHDDMHRRAPSVELMTTLLSRGLQEGLALRDSLAAHGRLCCHGLISAIDDPAGGLHRAFALGDGMLQALTTIGTDWRARFPDAAAVDLAEALPLVLFPDADRLQQIAKRLATVGNIMVGLWGRSSHGVDDAAVSLAAAAGRPLRRLIPGDAAAVSAGLATARALGALLWIESDGFGGAGQENEFRRLTELIAGARQDIVVTGLVPWSPLRILERKTLIDFALAEPSGVQRQALWHASVPESAPETRDALASLYRISPREMRIAATTARAQAASQGGAEELDPALLRACRALSLRRCNGFATAIQPRRRPEDLVLPAALHRQVLEVAAFYRGRGIVDEDWGFGRLLSGAGMKVLLTGDSGTGKTAAAEVIARQLGADQILMKIHLASVVSKWVGETEKNLDAVFHQAEESNAVLFFDEADALFAKRGEVERGADRYANLEVGFLLQRLEAFAGLAILASNHKDQIDEAFMRRFHVVLHFPRPTVAERRRLWSLALPATAPLAADIDIEVLQQLDLTGAGIFGAARGAALLASERRGASARIGMADLVEAVSRQFQYEARLLPAAQLGAYAGLVGKVA